MGWQFLQATMDKQRSAFDNSTDVNRDLEYFKENIGNVTSAEDLVNNRQLLSVTLSAFGLEDQINSKFLIQRVLEEGTEDGSLASRLSDGRYTALAGAFDFTPRSGANTQEVDFGRDLLKAYEERVLAKMEAGLTESGDLNTSYGAAVREQVAQNIQIESEAFAQSIGSIKTAEDLMNKPNLLLVALTAFGLEDKLDSPNLIRTVLEQGANEATDLARVLGDERFVELASTFGFEKDPVSPLQDSDFVQEILKDYKIQKFEASVGEVNETLRFALNFDRAIPELAGNDSSDNTKWFQVLGTTSLRQVFEKSLGLPAGFSQIDLDKQLETLKDKMERRFGVKEFNDIAENDTINRMIETYLLQSEIQNNASFGSNQVALTMLQSIPRIES